MSAILAGEKVMEMNWSRWFRCESSFSLLLVPNQPGIFALAEEIIQPADGQSRRMLAVFEVQEAEDLARSMSRLFAAGSPWREKLGEARCYLRYAVAPGIADRRAAASALKTWLNSQREVAAQIFEQKPTPARAAAEQPELKTVAEQAVDRVTHGVKLTKAATGGF
jgi:acyl-CoA reductase-like NAD-dependent aldehyde dehydrogenase